MTRKPAMGSSANTFAVLDNEGEDPQLLADLAPVKEAKKEAAKPAAKEAKPGAHCLRQPRQLQLQFRPSFLPNTMCNLRETTVLMPRMDKCKVFNIAIAPS